MWSPLGGVPLSSSSSSSSAPPLKSDGPLCSLGPPCYWGRQCLDSRVCGSGLGTYICVACDEVPHVAGRVLVQFLVLAKDEDGDVNRAEDRELVCLLEQAAFALEECAVVWRQLVSRCFGGQGESRTYTERFLSSLMAFISIFLRPMLASFGWFVSTKTDGRSRLFPGDYGRVANGR